MLLARGARLFSSASADAASFSRLVRARRSAGFLDPARAVPAAVVDELVAATARTPSGFNMQPYRVVLLTDPRARERVAAAMVGAANASRVRDAPLVAVFAADLRAAESVGEVQEMEAAAGGRSPAYLRELPFAVAAFAGGGGGGECGDLRGAAAGALHALGVPLPPFGVPGAAWAFKQAALAAMTYVYSATSQGLATRVLEGLDPSRAAAAVGLPAPRFSVPLLVVAGYELQPQPGGAPPPSPRRIKGVFFRDSAAVDY
jgi:nitroreductase